MQMTTLMLDLKDQEIGGLMTLCQREHRQSLANLKGWPAERWLLTQSWLMGLVNEKSLHDIARYVPEAVAILNTEGKISRTLTEVDVEVEVSGLLGSHGLIEGRTLTFSVDGFLSRMNDHKQRVIPAFHEYHSVRNRIIAEERDKLRLHEFKPRPLSSFVRNRLINES